LVILVKWLQDLSSRHYDVTGNFNVCEACFVGDSKQKNINRDWKGGSSIGGEQSYVDISSIKDLALEDLSFGR
jgi:hypothetical protein